MMEFRRINNKKHILWSSDMIISLITNKYPHLLKIYNEYPHFIMRVDLAKYIILDYYGGFYVDMDTKCLKNFNGLIKFNTNNKVMVCHVTDDKRTKLYAKKFINNHFFFVPIKNHPFMTLMLKEIPKKAERRKVESMILYILRAVGPGFLMHCIKKYKKLQQKQCKINKKQSKSWKLINIGVCGSNATTKLHTNDVMTVIRSDLLNQYFIHQSKNTWLEKEWLDKKDKKDALKIAASSIIIMGAAACIIVLIAL